MGNVLHTSAPSHIAIIMDGNGRWAEAQQLPRYEGHLAGFQAVKKVIQTCVKHHVPVLSLFAFSSENWQRPEAEVSHLMQLFAQALEQEISLLEQHQVSVRFIGNLTQLSPLLQELMARATRQTQHHQRLILNIAVNYGGKWDLLEATKTLVKKALAKELSVDQIDDTHFEACLATAGLPDPDLFIRTSGEQRISNFFLWQLAYTELFFSPVYWPDFDEAHLLEAMEAFRHRDRRFGRTPQET